METFNIIAIDPGNNLGISIYTINNEIEIVNIETLFYSLDNHITCGYNDNKLLLKLDKLKSIINVILNRYNPRVVAMESAFMNMRFPLAVTQLSSYISTIMLETYNFNNTISIFTLPPKYIKKHIGGSGSDDKNGVLDTVMLIDEITNYIDINNITEHEIDSLAIGYIVYKEIKTCNYLAWYNI